MEKMLADRTLSDVTFKFPGRVDKFVFCCWFYSFVSYIFTDGIEIKAHSILLASADSPVLAAMFQHDCKESRNLVVEMEDISPEVFEEVLQYLYTGSIKEMDKLAMDLLVAADKYQIESLKKECASALSKKLTVDSAVRIFVLAHLHNCLELGQSSLTFIAKNAKAIVALPDWLDLVMNYPKLSVEATQAMLGPWKVEK